MKKLWRKALYALAGRLPLRIISEGTRPYLERYYLFSLFGARCYLHRFVGDDPARGLHDHPWPWAYSVILAGEYIEVRRDGARRVRWFNSLRGDSFHRVLLLRNEIEIPTFFRTPIKTIKIDEKKSATLYHDYSTELVPTPCWSLFIHEAKTNKPWGFWRDTTPINPTDIHGSLTIGSGPPALTAEWTQHTYAEGGMGSAEWWHTAPKGRDQPQRSPQD